MTDTYGQLPGPVQALDLVDPVPDRSQLLLETFFLNDIPCNVKNQQRIGSDIVIYIDANDVVAVQF